MGMQYKQGFTIIEVILFLAITGLLAVTLLTGWTTMINTQRYRDSVKTVQSFIQQQYGQVYNVQNGRDADLNCATGGADGPEVGDGSSKPVGQTACIVMGRYIHVTGGTKIEVYSIIGEDGESAPTAEDNTIILERNPIRLDQSLNTDDSKLDIPWQARVVDGNTVNTLNAVIAIVRSPQTGAVHTYSKKTANAIDMPTVKQLILTVGSENGINLCLDAESALSGGRMGVAVQPLASSQSSIVSIPDGPGGACQ